MSRRRVPSLIAVASLVAATLVGVATPAQAAGIWRPTVNPNPNFKWQWQLTGTVDINVPADMFDIDLYDNSANVIAAIHARRAVVICYFSAGSWENWRPDAGSFLDSVKGKSNGWPGEKWLDIRSPLVLNLMAARMKVAASKGCDGVEPDNVDGYSNSTGFPLTATDQITYNRNIAALAHARNLSVALKNDVDQTAALVSDFDWALNEECNAYSECGTYKPFTDVNKLVLNVEYKGTVSATSGFCYKDKAKKIIGMKKNLDLGVSRTLCP